MSDWPTSARQVRDRYGWTQEQAADYFRVRRATWSDWERGEKEPQGPAKTLMLVLLGEQEIPEA